MELERLGAWLFSLRCAIGRVGLRLELIDRRFGTLAFCPRWLVQVGREEHMDPMSVLASHVQFVVAQVEHTMPMTVPWSVWVL